MVDPRGTPQLCSSGHEVVPKALSERMHVCPPRGYTADRDLNAAKNILDRVVVGPGSLTWPVAVCVLPQSS